jgi:hypothetical protein
VVVDVPPLTGSTGGGSHSHTYGGITTDTGSSTDSKLGSVDIIPPYIGLLFIMKVKKPS